MFDTAPFLNAMEPVIKFNAFNQNVFKTLSNNQYALANKRIKAHVALAKASLDNNQPEKIISLAQAFFSEQQHDYQDFAQQTLQASQELASQHFASDGANVTKNEPKMKKIAAKAAKPAAPTAKKSKAKPRAANKNKASEVVVPAGVKASPSVSTAPKVQKSTNKNTSVPTKPIATAAKQTVEVAKKAEAINKPAQASKSSSSVTSTKKS